MPDDGADGATASPNRGATTTSHRREERVVDPRLLRIERLLQLPLVLAAVLPIVMALDENSSLWSDAIYIISWLVFVLDFVVHMKWEQKYLGRVRGKFDLVVVILTAPWFLLPGFQTTRFVLLVRFARLGRLVVASGSARRLFRQLGRAAAVAVAMTLVCSYVALQAERDTNPQFTDYGVALFWGVVTLTTVGYGNVVPITPVGEWTAVVLMITGVGIIGTLAGSLAGFLRLDPTQPADGGDATGTITVTTTEAAEAAGRPAEQSLADELAALRVKVAELDADLSRLAARAGDRAS